MESVLAFQPSTSALSCSSDSEAYNFHILLYPGSFHRAVMRGRTPSPTGRGHVPSCPRPLSARGRSPPRPGFSGPNLHIRRNPEPFEHRTYLLSRFLYPSSCVGLWYPFTGKVDGEVVACVAAPHVLTLKSTVLLIDDHVLSCFCRS